MSRTVALGALGGFGAGIVMIGSSMIAFTLTGQGAWAPLNYIAHTAWRAVPLDGRWSLTGVVVGGIVHLAVSVFLGMLLAAVFSGKKHRLSSATVLFIGVAYGMLLWMVNHLVLWPRIDRAAAEAYTPSVFLTSHLLYGLVLAICLVPILARRGGAVA